jgi:hypothetical protein
MHDSDPKKPSPRPQPVAAQPDHLLDELTSIRALLDSEQRGTTGTNVPLLDDVVGFAASFKAVEAAPSPALLDLERIFSDSAGDLEATPAFPRFTLDVALSDAPGESGAMVDPLARDLRANYRREALIQELVAEFLPQIEATLRARLQGLDDEALHALKKPD